MLNINLKKQLALFLLALSASFSALANQADHISVIQPFAREVPPTAMASASFMTLKNNSQQAILLVKADSAVAKMVQLHKHIHDHGVMRMVEVPNIKIPANGVAQLKPGGFHIMLIHLTRHIKAGDQIKLTLTFGDGSHKTITMPVKSLMSMPMKHMK